MDNLVCLPSNFAEADASGICFLVRLRAAPNGVSSDGMPAPSEIDASMFTELPSFFGKPTTCMGEIGGEEVTK